MNVFRKLNTLFRAGARESAERITDANAIRIYRQEIIDAESLLESRRLALAGLIGSRRDLDKEIQATRSGIEKREQQIASVPVAQRSEDLLLMCARDISNNQAQLVKLEQRLNSITERISREEISLRRLRTEIREHRRELQILATEAARGGTDRRSYRGTITYQLQILEETRVSIAGGVSDTDVREASMAEAVERVDGDPLDRELADRGLDDASATLAGIVSRLRNLDSPATA